MPHYLIRLSASPVAVEEILEQPRFCMKEVRAATREVGGHLDGCWFTEGEDGLIALVHVPRQLENAVLRDRFARVWEGMNVEVQSLLTLHEVNDRPRDDERLVREELWSDPVDLSSDLSFPASDPPGWMSRYPVPAEEPR